MKNKTIGGLLVAVLAFGFIFSMPEISRVSTLKLDLPGPHYSPGPNEPLGPFPNIEFSHPHYSPGPNEPVGPSPEKVTPPHCTPGPNEPLGPHNRFTQIGSTRSLSFGNNYSGCNTPD